VLGRQIIEELNLPPEKRTITPEQGIGEAGGTKYILVLTPPPLPVSFFASPRIASREQLSSPGRGRKTIWHSLRTAPTPPSSPFRWAPGRLLLQTTEGHARTLWRREICDEGNLCRVAQHEGKLLVISPHRLLNHPPLSHHIQPRLSTKAEWKGCACPSWP
jgi:hypothetical protein